MEKINGPRWGVISILYLATIFLSIVYLWSRDWQVTLKGYATSEVGLFFIALIFLSPEMFRYIYLSEQGVIIKYYGLFTRNMEWSRVTRIELTSSQRGKMLIFEFDNCPPKGNMKSEYMVVRHPLRTVGFMVLGKEEAQLTNLIRKYCPEHVEYLRKGKS